MTSIANFLRGTDPEFFDLFERAACVLEGIVIKNA